MFGSESLVTILLCVGVAGWLAALAVEGYGLGLVGNLVVGTLGTAAAALAALALEVQIEERMIGIIAATGGAMLVLVLVGLARRL